MRGLLYDVLSINVEVFLITTKCFSTLLCVFEWHSFQLLTSMSFKDKETNAKVEVMERSTLRDLKEIQKVS